MRTLRARHIQAAAIWITITPLITADLGAGLAIEHPHIIVRESEYDELRSRASRWPWSVMRQKAIRDARQLDFDFATDDRSQHDQAQSLASSLALAYVLDPAHRGTYIDKVRNVLARAMAQLRNKKEAAAPTDVHLYHVWPSTPAFMTYLVLDIMYGDLPAGERKAIEDDLDYIASNHRDSWQASKYAIEAMMELYHRGPTPVFVARKNDFLRYLHTYITADGVYNVGPGYTLSRVVMDRRIQKKIFMDVCEYQGYREFYSNERLRNLHEWIWGYSITPFNRTYTFGDSPPVKTYQSMWSAATLRASRFGEKAGGYAAWAAGPFTNEQIQGRLLHYILCDSVPPRPKWPRSRIFLDGGAWLIESIDSDRALAGALWNTTNTPHGHTHKDTNAIQIVGYGEHILRNSGYDGWRKPDPAGWEWINDRAESGNTLLISNTDHQDKRGGGIIEGFVGGDLEFAGGASGPAMGGNNHQRNLILVQPRNGTRGYFLLLDEVSTTVPEQTASLAIHPNSGLAPQTLLSNTAFRWKIGGCHYSSHDVAVDVFLATPPASIQIKEGHLGSYDACSSFDGKYLYADYPTNPDGRASIVSVIFPSDETHPVASMSRVEAHDGTGVRIEHGNSIVDYALGMDQPAEIVIGGVRFRGLGSVYRIQDMKVDFYFVRKGMYFDDGANPRVGFEVVSGAPVTIYMKGASASVASSGSEVRLFHPSIAKPRLDGVAARVLETGERWVTIRIPPGTHEVRF